MTFPLFEQKCESEYTVIVVLDPFMTEVQCQDCLKKFRDAHGLKRHRARATPCTLIVEAPDEGNSCKYCGRQFTTKHSMHRHIKQSCKIANSSEGMEALFRHTVQKSEERNQALVAQNIAQNKELLEQKGKITELEKVMAQLATVQIRLLSAETAVAAPAPHVTINNTTYNNTQNITIQPWNRDEDRIVIPASMLRAAFTENPKLVEYCRMSAAQQSDKDEAMPYMIEALIDLVKRAHKEPSARNAYLSPSRADMVMVFDEATWKVIPLMEAIQAIVDSVALQIKNIVRLDDAPKLLSGVYDPVANATFVYNCHSHSDDYATQAKSRMVAHLMNNAPPRLK
jgi:hypothetical protein